MPNKYTMIEPREYPAEPRRRCWDCGSLINRHPVYTTQLSDEQFASIESRCLGCAEKLAKHPKRFCFA